MPAELMERPRRGTGRTRSRAGRREGGIPPLRRRGPAALAEGLPGIPRGDLGPPDVALEPSGSHAERSRSPGRAGAGSGAGTPSPRSHRCRRGRGLEEGIPIPAPAAHRASLISVKANSCSAC